MSYDSRTDQVYRLIKESVQARKLVRDGDGALTTVAMTAFPLNFLAGVACVILASIRQYCDEYCKKSGPHGYVECGGAG